MCRENIFFVFYINLKFSSTNPTWFLLPAPPLSWCGVGDGGNRVVFSPPRAKCPCQVAERLIFVIFSNQRPGQWSSSQDMHFHHTFSNFTHVESLLYCVPLILFVKSQLKSHSKKNHNYSRHRNCVSWLRWGDVQARLWLRPRDAGGFYYDNTDDVDDGDDDDDVDGLGNMDDIDDNVNVDENINADQ